MAKRRKNSKRSSTGTGPSTAAVPRGRPPKNAAAGRLLAQMASYRSTLLDDLDSVQSQIDSIEAAMAKMGSAPSGRRRGRPPGGGGGRGFREGSVKGFILKALKGNGEMAVKDVAKSVLKLGYGTDSNNFPNQVSNALAQMPQVTKMGRGRYKL